jgi:hypothetical protein
MMGRGCTAFRPTSCYSRFFRKKVLAAEWLPNHIVQRGIVVIDDVPYVF